ncbi:Beta-1,4-galactosyltransferase 5 [Collichthys lucidus]|uniref:Beta-1,4-galactosyltransferase 5 n=1 Tax=Collichthys lucidus TaxID=240159 RepID=A0A4V6ASI5_COLLU|nr:Beta-1,4-galactosyltransferase 5 [Collichthys lucidus]
MVGRGEEGLWVGCGKMQYEEKRVKDKMNEYVFLVQARGIQIRENVKNIGAQVLEQVVRGAYSINGTDYAYDFNMSESDAPPTTYLPEGFTYLPSQVCPERLPYMKGRLEVNMSEISLEEVERSLLEEESIAPGGYWKPKDCLPRWKVAILVPFRNRHEHLPILLRHLVPVLQKQRLHFAFYFIEQVTNRTALCVMLLPKRRQPLQLLLSPWGVDL